MGDIGLLAQHVITMSEQLQQQLKLVKRRLPHDTSVTNLGLNKEVSENLYQCYQHSGKILKTLHDIVKGTIQALNTAGGKYISTTKKSISHYDVIPLKNWHIL